MNAVTSFNRSYWCFFTLSIGKIRLWGSVGYAIMAQVSGLLYQYISPFANFMAGILGTLITIICIYMVSDPKLSEVPEKEENKLSTVVVMKELVHNIPFMLFLVISFFFLGSMLHKL